MLDLKIKIDYKSLDTLMYLKLNFFMSNILAFLFSQKVEPNPSNSQIPHMLVGSKTQNINYTQQIFDNVLQRLSKVLVEG